MSLILEALKKSEAKRRLGEAPDLGTPFAAPRRRSSALPLLFIAIIVAGAFGWWYLRKPAPATDRAVVADAAGQRTARPSVAATSSSSPQAITSAATPAPTARAQPSTPQVAARQASAPASPGKNPPLDANAVEASKWVAMGSSSSGLRNRGAAQAGRKLPSNMHRVEPATAAPTKAPPVTTAAAQVAAAPPVPTQTVKNSEAGAAAPVAAVLAKATKTPEMRAVAPTPEPHAATPEPAAASAAAPAVKSDVPFYYELPFNLRKSLPPLRLSMHVYAGEPKQRFVILNDSRLAEGDKTSDDVTLREVRKDGAILEFQGQRFFYPRDM
jgi:general secretion pathway protein B